LIENQRDLDAAVENNLSDAMVDRLRLTSQRIDGIAGGMEEIAAFPDPVGEIISGGTRPGGLRMVKQRVPLGVVFFIYESRPNVTADAAAICVKSGNAVILRGGKEAMHSSRAIVALLQEQAGSHGLPEHAIQLVQTIDRAAVGHFLQCDDSIDVAIPRGGKQLIQRVVRESTMPVMKHYDGNCHVYVDADAQFDMALSIVENSKCQRMGVCNACESVLVHQDIASSFIPQMVQRLKDVADVEVRGDQDSIRACDSILAATVEDYATEYLGPVVSVKIVESTDQAIEHINRFGSHHTDAIVTDNLQQAQHFAELVDSAAVMVNASTRFNDGGMFGLGAEIGISTDKFHARGPCGVRELTTYKYVVTGNGNVRT
ncbi:MAG: glutamate-5-semialdehyde dehydrogenase, partial [Planctomycetota bacterium]